MTESAYETLGENTFRASALTGGPWSPEHQHAGPPSALICRAVERAAAPQGFTHIGRLTVNLLRPVPIGDCGIEIRADHLGRGAGHFSGLMTAGDKEVALFTALAQREQGLRVPEGTPGHPPPTPLKPPAESPLASMGFAVDFGYARLIENRLAAGRMSRGPSTVWFRLNHPLIAGETPSPYQRVAVAADSGNGVSAALDFSKYVFVNCDLTINLFRRPLGEWICLDARSWFGGNSCGMAESALYDETGLIGRATQSLAVRAR
jgi:hypothetical protein